jgi:CpXC protein
VFVTMQAQCPECEAAWEIEVVGSVNADRAPELRDAVLDGSFQEQICDKCGLGFRLPPRLTYVDFGRGQWFVAHPGDEVSRWPDHEAMADEMFESTFATGAPPAVREMAAGVRRRVVFGWPALREKLLCQEHDLDDVSMELFKTAVLRYVPGAPFSDATELRFDGLDDGALVLTWFVAGTEQRLSRLVVPRAAFGAFEREPGWGALRATFDNAAFVDMERLMSRV